MGSFTSGGKLRIIGHENKLHGEGIQFSFRFNEYLKKEEAFSLLEERLQNEIDWFYPKGSPLNYWILDVPKLLLEYPHIDRYNGWLKGLMRIIPTYEIKEDEEFGQPCKNTVIFFKLVPGIQDSKYFDIDVPELKPFIERFKLDHPDLSKCAFIMMRFDDTRLHKEILDVVRKVCKKHGLKALRADDKRYSDDLFSNIRTYMHCCRFGIAIFERLSLEEFNPNVSLEVGYMMAQGKPVCLLKDKTLNSLHTDLIGRLYENFDIQDPEYSIPTSLEKWLKDKEIIFE